MKYKVFRRLAKRQRNFILTVFLFVVFTANSFALANLQHVNAFINENKEIKQTAIIHHNYKQRLKSGNSEDKSALSIVNKVLLAETYSENLDKLNEKSLSLYLEALGEAEKLQDTNLLIYVNTQIGYFYYSYNEYVKAMPFFIRSSRLLDITSSLNLLQPNDVYKKNAYFFGSVNEHRKSIEYLQKALKFTPSYSKEYGTLLNNIGSSYYKLGNTDKAAEYFLKTRQISLENNDKVRYAKALGDLALIHFNKEEYQQALDLLLEDLAISLENNAERNTMYARILLGEIYVKTNQFDKAKSAIDLASAYLETKDYLKSQRYDVAKINLEIALKTNNLDLELTARRALDSLRKDIADKDGQEAVNLVNWETQKINFGRQLEIEKAKLEQANLIKWTFITVSLVLVVALTFIIFSVRKRFKVKMSEHERKILAYKVEQLQSEQKLRESHATLQSYQSYLTNNSKRMEQLEKELEHIQTEIPYKAESAFKIKSMIADQQVSDENWLGLKKTFMKEQNDYYDYLLKSFPDLSEMNLRIVILNKMKLSSAEIAMILNVKKDVIEEALHRLHMQYKGNFDHYRSN